MAVDDGIVDCVVLNWCDLYSRAALCFYTCSREQGITEHSHSAATLEFNNLFITTCYRLKISKSSI